jgi:hypothetical protein
MKVNLGQFHCKKQVRMQGLANFLVTYELSIVRRLQGKGRQNGQKSFWNNAVSFVEQSVPRGY